MKGKIIMSKRKLKKKKEEPKFYEIIEGVLVMNFGNLSIEITECAKNAKEVLDSLSLERIEIEKFAGLSTPESDIIFRDGEIDTMEDFLVIIMAFLSGEPGFREIVFEAGIGCEFRIRKNNIRIKEEIFNDIIIDKYTKSEQILEEAEYIDEPHYIEALMFLTQDISENLKNMNFKKEEYLNLQKNMESISQVLKEVYDGYRAIPFLETGK
jgi:hypothetical protein